MASSPPASPAASSARGPNPLAFLGLRRVGDSPEQSPPPAPGSPSKGGVMLNRRGLPARKRKKNSLIYGMDEVVSIPVRSPKKRGTPKAAREVAPAIPEEGDDAEEAEKADDSVADEERDEAATRKRRRRANTPPPRSNAALSSPRPKRSPARRTRATTSLTSTPERRRLEMPGSPSKRMASPSKRLGSPSKRLMSPSKRLMSPVKPQQSYPRSAPVSRHVTPSKSIKKKLLLNAEELELTSPEKKVAQSLGVALRNLLKLPKAHKWVCFEFFYSNIDKVLFEGENDFMVCLRESFPQLSTRKLTRVEWCKVRRLMGKPRRCSAAFFEEERAELARKRLKIRTLQQRKQAGDVSNLKDLPEHIPLQLTIGSRVTARLRRPQDGLFTGAVDAYDTSNSTYRVTFDRAGLGTHSIPDYEVLATDDPETMPLSSFTARARPRPPAPPPSAQQQQTTTHGLQQSGSNASSPYNLSPLKYGSVYSPQLANDPLLSGSTPRGKLDGVLGGYPVRFLDLIVRLSKTLRLKRERVNTLKELNAAGERRKSFGEYINEDFQRKYASTVMDLAQINRDLNEYFNTIREYTQEFSNEAGPTISLPNMVREGCQEDAYELVNKINTSEDRQYVENPRVLALVSSLTALMMQVQHLALAEGGGGASGGGGAVSGGAAAVQALQESLREVRLNIHETNAARFQDHVEVHMQHIQSGLTQMNNLSAFNISPQRQQQQVQQQQQVKTESVPPSS